MMKTIMRIGLKCPECDRPFYENEQVKWVLNDRETAAPWEPVETPMHAECYEALFKTKMDKYDGHSAPEQGKCLVCGQPAELADIIDLEDDEGRMKYDFLCEKCAEMLED